MKQSLIIIILVLAPLVAVNARDMGKPMAQMLDLDNTRLNTDAGTAAQYNEAVAINYQNPNNAIAVWDDMRLGYPRVAIARTVDGGQSWTDALLDLPTYASQSDPTVAADTDGNFFACMIAGDTTGLAPDDIILLRSTDGGLSWSDPMIALSGSAEHHDLKPHITVDNTRFGSYGFIYITWMRYTNDISSSRIYCTATFNGGESFLQPVIVSDAEGSGWPTIAVLSHYDNGDVISCWFRDYPTGLYWDYSNTEGWNFNADLRMTLTGLDEQQVNGGIAVSTAPVLACDNNYLSPGFEWAYLVYTDSSSSDLDIYCISVHTIGNYLSRSSPVVVNDNAADGTDQFMPAVAVDDAGTVHVAFLDRRNDLTNLLYDVDYTFSTDLGATWSSDVRVTSVSSNPAEPGVAGQIGNRIGIAAWGGHVYITWTDCRNGNTDVYTSRMMETGISEQPTPLPKEISFDNLYPNPFNSSVEIKYSSPMAQRVSLDVIDLLGRHVTNLFDGLCQTGSNSLIWNGRGLGGRDVSSGVYFVRLNAGGRTMLKKAVLLR